VFLHFIPSVLYLCRDASHHGNSTDLANTTLVGNSTTFENITDLSNTTGHGSDHPYYINGHLYIDLHHVPAFTHLQSYNRTGTVYPIGVDPVSDLLLAAFAQIFF